METVNEQFDEYRDCLRIVWNYALRHRLKGAISYPDVSEALLSALVLDDLSGATDKNTRRTSEGYIPALGVIASVKNPFAQVQEVRDGEIIWKAVDPGDEIRGVPLHYVDVFDFRDADQMLELEYVKAFAPKDIGDVRKGEVLLLRRSQVDVIELTCGLQEITNPNCSP